MDRLQADQRGGAEGQALQGVTGEDGSGLIECLVAGGPAAAQIIIVHGR
jgi:hypothetical protein